MLRHSFLVAALSAAWCACNPVWAAQSDLVSEDVAAQHGLVRPWLSQVELDQVRSKIGSVMLFEGVLYIQTTTATIHAIDAETGRTVWSQQIGRPDYPTMPPDAKGDFLAAVNGSQLYLVNRLTGEVICDKAIKDAPGGGPAISSKRIFVPTETGLIISYRIELPEKPKKESHNSSGKGKTEPVSTSAAPIAVGPPPKIQLAKKVPPVFCQSFGRALVQPLVTRDDVGGEYVVWPTDRGYLNLGRVSRDVEDSVGVKYRLETGATIIARPAYLPPDPKVLGDAGMVFAGSCDGFVYAIQEETGATAWRFSTGEPIVEPPAVIGNRVYVATQLGGMFCLSRKNGRNVWRAEGVMRFIAASKTRVYALDDAGRLLILDAASGSRLDAVPLSRTCTVLANSDTDRIYLIGRSGLIQCLHETEQTEPLTHNKERKDAAKAGLTPPEPKKETTAEKPARKPPKKASEPKEHKEPKATKEPKPLKEKPPKKEKPPRKTPAGRKGIGPAGDNPGGNPPGQPAPKGVAPKSPVMKGIGGGVKAL
jgi:outer membrane protein assembly factor BamB